MTLWSPKKSDLSLPLFGAPLFLGSGPELVIAQCKAGVVGSLPALNARSQTILDEWLARIERERAEHDARNPARPAAPYAVNLAVHRSNASLDAHLDVCVAHRTPLIITSMGADPRVNDVVHAYGGTVLHDVTNLAHARKAIDKGADGLIAVAAGAGGHAGALSPFALIQEIRDWFEGPLLLSGAIATGQAVLSAQIMGADMAYCGSCFIPAEEADAPPDYKQMILDATAADIVYTREVTGTPASFLRKSLLASGFDGDGAPVDRSASRDGARAWRDIWSAGHGVGSIRARSSVADIVATLADEYRAALKRAGAATPRRP